MKFSKRIIIGGLPRSGTTLFRYVLDASSRIICGPETSFFLRPLTEQRKRAHWVAARVNRALEIGEDVIIEALARARRSVECFDAVMTIYQQTAGESKDIWAEKSPRNCLSYEWLYDEEPEIYFVSLIRDGRDVVTSIVEGSDEYHVTIDRYVESLEAIYRFKRGRHLVVRYEDLVCIPEPTFRKVFDFLELDFEPEALQKYREQSVTRNRTKVNQPKVEQDISVQWVGRWAAPEHAERIRNFLADDRACQWLERTGYT